MKKGPFQILDHPKGGYSISPIDFNLLISSWLNFRILVLQFNRLQSQIERQSTNFKIPVSISRRFNLIFDCWFAQFDSPNSSKSDSSLSNHEFLILVFKLIQSPISCSKFLDSRFPNPVFGRDSDSWFLFKSRLNANSFWKNQSHFSRWARLILGFQIIRFLSA